MQRFVGICYFSAFFFLAASQYFSGLFWQSDNAVNPLTRNMSYVGLLLLLFPGFVVMVRNTDRMKAYAPAAFLFAFTLLAMLSTIYSLSPTRTLASVVVFVAMVTCLGAVAALPEYRRVAFTCAGFGMLAGIAVLAALLPFRTRSFGFVQPNLLASFGYAGLFMAFLGLEKYRKFLIAMGCFIIILAQARTITVGLLVFFWLMILPKISSRNSKSMMILLSFVGVFGALIVLDELAPIMVAALSAILGVTSDARNDTSFTGRTDTWEKGLNVFWENPLFGHGFSSRGISNLDGFGVNAHSGIINSLADNGIIGTAMFVGMLLFIAFRFLQHHLLTSSSETYVSFALVASMPPIFLMEPNYIAFIHPLQIVLLGVVGVGCFHSLQRYSTHPHLPVITRRDAS